VSTFSNVRLSTFYPNWDFWFENTPSGNPDFDRSVRKMHPTSSSWISMGAMGSEGVTVRLNDLRNH
jgi:hypothetical protein